MQLARVPRELVERLKICMKFMAEFSE